MIYEKLGLMWDMIGNTNVYKVFELENIGKHGNPRGIGELGLLARVKLLPVFQ